MTKNTINKTKSTTSAKDSAALTKSRYSKGPSRVVSRKKYSKTPFTNTKSGEVLHNKIGD